jgi:hypothetical protein
MKKILSLLILILAFAFVTAFAQKTNEAVEWVRVQNETGEFSIEMPSNFIYFYDKEGFNYDVSNKTYSFQEMRMLNAASEKTVMRVEIYKVSSPKKHLNELLERDRLQGSKSEESRDGFTIKQVSQNKFNNARNKTEVEINFVSRFIASKTHLYVVTVANRGAQSAVAARFLNSIRLNQAQAASSDTTKIVNLSSLTPLTIAQIGENEENAKKQPQTTQPVKPVDKTEKSGNPLLVLAKPIAGYTEAARMSMTNGTISLRVTFAKDGSIPKIAVISGLENGLTRNAFFCALRIRFIPQESENEPVTAAKIVQYSFSIG